MRNDYRNRLKRKSKEGLIISIDSLKQVIKDRAKFKTTREEKMLAYATMLLNQLIDNEKTEYKGIDSIANDYINTLI
jgi:hypothetical protein